jgi:Protein of unknown function (DUF3551)
MRKTILAMMTVLAAGVASVAGSVPATASDYAWCLQGRGVGIPGDCTYATYAQCMASASGRGLYCGVNPRVAFAQQYRGGPLPGYYGGAPPGYGYYQGY